jgi:membrane protein
MAGMLSKIDKFFSYDIWHKHNLKGYKAKLYFYLRIIVISIRGYLEDRIGLRASALTFYTLLSVVPVLALLFGIAHGFGLKTVLINQLKRSLEGHEEIVDYVVEFANSMLQNTQGGWLAGIGIIVLFWSVIKVLWNIELSFNFIWQVKKQRNYIRMITDYLAIIILGPILVILAGSISIFITKEVSQLSSEVSVLESFSTFIVILLNLSPYIIIWILLTLLYMVMPFTNVKFKSAFIAALIAGTSFQLVQWAYIHFQIGVSGYNAVYGSFAAFPMLLVFLQISWTIVLVGAKLSFAYQNVGNFEFEKDIQAMSYFNKQLACISALHFIVKTFESGDKPKSIADIVQKFDAPYNLIRYIVDTLSECNLIAETEMEDRVVYLPTSDIHKLKLSDVIIKLNDHGPQYIPFNDRKIVPQLRKKMQNIHEELNLSENNILIMDLKS